MVHQTLFPAVFAWSVACGGRVAASRHSDRENSFAHQKNLILHPDAHFCVTFVSADGRMKFRRRRRSGSVGWRAEFRIKHL